MALKKVIRETYVLSFCVAVGYQPLIMYNATKIIKEHDKVGNKSQKLLKDNRTVTYVHETTIHQERLHY